jgi:hypothetical protein
MIGRVGDAKREREESPILLDDDEPRVIRRVKVENEGGGNEVAREPLNIVDGVIVID